MPLRAPSATTAASISEIFRNFKNIFHGRARLLSRLLPSARLPTASAMRMGVSATIARATSMGAHIGAVPTSAASTPTCVRPVTTRARSWAARPFTTGFRSRMAALSGDTARRAAKKARPLNFGSTELAKLRRTNEVALSTLSNVMTHEPASQSHGRSSKHGSHKKAATLMAVASESAAPGKQDRRSDGEVSNRAPTRCADRPVYADSKWLRQDRPSTPSCVAPSWAFTHHSVPVLTGSVHSTTAMSVVLSVSSVDSRTMLLGSTQAHASPRESLKAVSSSKSCPHWLPEAEPIGPNPSNRSRQMWRHHHR